MAWTPVTKDRHQENQSVTNEQCGSGYATDKSVDRVRDETCLKAAWRDVPKEETEDTKFKFGSTLFASLLLKGTGSVHIKISLSTQRLPLDSSPSSVGFHERSSMNVFRQLLSESGGKYTSV